MKCSHCKRSEPAFAVLVMDGQAESFCSFECFVNNMIEFVEEYVVEALYKGMKSFREGNQRAEKLEDE